MGYGYTGLCRAVFACLVCVDPHGAVVDFGADTVHVAVAGVARFALAGEGAKRVDALAVFVAGVDAELALVPVSVALLAAVAVAALTREAPVAAVRAGVVGSTARGIFAVIGVDALGGACFFVLAISSRLEIATGLWRWP